MSRLADVEYLATSKLDSQLRRTVADLEKNFNAIAALNTLFFKRSAFSHESEVRLVIHARTPKNKPERTHVTIPFVPHRVITDVMVDPRASDQFLDVVQYYLRANLKFRGNVRRSQLYSPIEAFEIGAKGG